MQIQNLQNFHSIVDPFLPLNLGASRPLPQDYGAQSWASIGGIRLYRRALETVLLEEGVAGDILEAGVDRGGTGVLAQTFLQAHSMHGCRALVLAEKYEDDSVMFAEMRDIKSTFSRYGALDENVHFLDLSSTQADDVITKETFDKGIAVLKIDVHQSRDVKQFLELAYRYVTEGGIVIVEDWDVERVRKAVVGFREGAGFTDAIFEVEGLGADHKISKAAYWRKGSGPHPSHRCIVDLCGRAEW